MKNSGFGALSDFEFFLWDTDSIKFRYGLVNVAAFLANGMVEAIGDDTCDELNWQQVAGRHAISNSCGQDRRSYQDETCETFACEVDTTLEITATDAGKGARSPPPLECRPKRSEDDFTGYWDSNMGIEMKESPYANSLGRIDIEGCCYFGRGVLLTRGSCNIGKLNYYLGARAAREGRDALYPNIDFCLDPEATCSSSFGEELSWTISMFEWAERVQTYQNNDWNYENELKRFLDNGMVDDTFIENVNRVLALGCHTKGCSNREVRMEDERKANFYTIINGILSIDDIVMPTDKPTQRPTEAPTTAAPIETTTSVATPPPIPVTTPVIADIGICFGIGGTVIIPINDCKDYVECVNGYAMSQQSCQSGLLFDTVLNDCSWAFQVSENCQTIRPPTLRPTTMQSVDLVSISDPVEGPTGTAETLIPLEGSGVGVVRVGQPFFILVIGIAIVIHII